MRPKLSLALLLLLAAAPAYAGSKATYTSGAGPTLEIEVADNGDARIGPAGQDQYGLLIGADFYLVGKEKGRWQVARLADQAAAFDRVMPPIFKSLFGAAAAGTKPAALTTKKTGTRTIAGITGDVYQVGGLDAAKPAETNEIVVSTDPKLKPVGRALNGFMEATFVMLAPLIGKAAAAEIESGKAIAALGTPIAGAQLTLASFAEASVDPARLALPAKPLTIDQIVAAIKISPLAE